MCFSAGADVAGGIVIDAVGVDALRHVGGRRRYVAIAALPLLLAMHQLVEAVVWWGLQGNVATLFGDIATWVYLTFAFMVLPVYVPAMILVLEPPGLRRRMMAPFVALGVVVASVLLAAMVRGPVRAELGDYYIA